MGKSWGTPSTTKDLFLHKNASIQAALTTQFTIKGLKPASDYQVSVAAFTSKGEGPRSEFTGYITTGMFE